ncbi:MAG TPA: preprotein translocase subunit SecY [Clostridiales bacterium UBA8153]|nr:preprotein translocase subunit SecY [Clostridiales bacterium UBA8153]
MLDTLRTAFRIGDLRRRILFTLWMFLVFRVGTAVSVPGIDVDVIAEMFREGSIFAFMDLFAGGALRTFSIFAMSITPYINASIIMQLLTVVIPKWEAMAKEEDGKKRLQQYVRYGTVILALIQATGMSFVLQRQGALLEPGIRGLGLVIITLTAGTAFLMWLGEQITDRGIGNGISLIIFAGIVSQLPSGMVNVFNLLAAGRISVFSLLLLTAIGLAVVAAVVWITEGERRVPVQYAKRVVGRRMYGGHSTHIPVRINQAGVIPVIFAASVLALPVTLAAFIAAPWARRLELMFNYRSPMYIATYMIFIVFFTYFYTAMVFNPIEVANNMKKQGGFIPGIRPGRPTSEQLGKIVSRITLVGAIFLALVAVLPNFMLLVTDIPGLQFGGTALLIVVGVALETMKQVESHLLMRQYQGFMR